MGILALSNLIICRRRYLMLPAPELGPCTTLWRKIKPLTGTNNLLLDSAGIATARFSLAAMAFDTWRVSRHLNKQPSDELFNASLRSRPSKGNHRRALARPRGLSRSLICADEFLTSHPKANL